MIILRCLSSVIPAQAGIHCYAVACKRFNQLLTHACGAIDPRLRGDDKLKNHNFAIIIAGFFLIVFLTNIADAKMVCATKDEKRAFNTKAMQSYLMVAALSCGERENYNQFMRKHGDELARNHDYIKDYFERNYRADAEWRMNKFITMLANESSKKSLNKNSANFCAEAKQIFDQVQSTNVSNLSDLAERQEFINLHKVKECR